MSDSIKQTLIAVSQLANCILSLYIGGGWADESLSARAYRCRWSLTMTLIDSLMGDARHCAKAYENERARAHLPPEYRT